MWDVFEPVSCVCRARKSEGENPLELHDEGRRRWEEAEREGGGVGQEEEKSRRLGE